MWSPFQILNKSEDTLGKTPRVPPVPLRKNTVNFADIIVGSTVRFSTQCTLPQLRGKTAQVHNIRQYHFEEGTIANFRLQLGKDASYSFSVTQDEQGQYLALSRQLNSAEQDQWFGRDALSFFTEASTAKTIRCKADLQIEGAWAAERYVKSIDWVEGNLSDGRQQMAFRYNLLLNEMGDKALEIEHYPAVQKNKIYITAYRPLEDIVAIGEPSDVPEVPEVAGGFFGNGTAKTNGNGAHRPATNGHHSNGYHSVATEEPPLFKDPLPFSLQTSRAEPAFETPPLKEEAKATRPDFRRNNVSEEIHIPASAPNLRMNEAEESSPPLPSFLLSREHNYVSLDAVITPESEQVRCGLVAARNLIDTALTRGVRVRDVMRDLVGLSSAMSDEAVFEMPLSDTDYRQLAQRYKLRPDHREEIRARLERELQSKLLGLPE